MSDEQVLKQIFVGSVVAFVGAIAGAIINLLLAERSVLTTGGFGV